MLFNPIQPPSLAQPNNDYYGRRSAPVSPTTPVKKTKKTCGVLKSGACWTPTSKKPVVVFAQENETQVYDPRLTPRDVSRRRRPTLPVVESPMASRRPSFWGDEQFTKSKIFQKRLDDAATLIQSVVRVRIYRRRYMLARLQHLQEQYEQLLSGKAIRIQTVARSFLAHKHCARLRAAVAIQSIFRGWRSRGRTRIAALEARLAAIEAQKQEQLAAIETKKQADHDHIHAKFGAVLARIEKREQTIAQANELIGTLRAQNKMVRDKNDSLAKAIFLMKADNKALETRTAALFVEMKKCRQQIDQIRGENQQWVDVLKQFDARKEDYELAIGRLQEHIDFEECVKGRMKEATEAVVSLMQSNAKDHRLVDEVVQASLSVEA